MSTRAVILHEFCNACNEILAFCIRHGTESAGRNIFDIKYLLVLLLEKLC